MRRFAFVAGLVLVASPLAAQQQSSVVEPAPAVEVQASAPESKPAESRAPTLHVSREQADAQVRASEQRRGRAASNEFLYTAAAVALGVIIALLLVD